MDVAGEDGDVTVTMVKVISPSSWGVYQYPRMLTLCLIGGSGILVEGGGEVLVE